MSILMLTLNLQWNPRDRGWYVISTVGSVTILLVGVDHEIYVVHKRVCYDWNNEEIQYL